MQHNQWSILNCLLCPGFESLFISVGGSPSGSPSQQPLVVNFFHSHSRNLVFSLIFYVVISSPRVAKLSVFLIDFQSHFTLPLPYSLFIFLFCVFCWLEFLVPWNASWQFPGSSSFRLTFFIFFLNFPHLTFPFFCDVVSSSVALATYPCVHPLHPPSLPQCRPWGSLRWGTCRRGCKVRLPSGHLPGSQRKGSWRVRVIGPTKWSSIPGRLCDGWTRGHGVRVPLVRKWRKGNWV